MENIVNYEDIFKVLEQFSEDIINNKICEEKIIITGLYQGIKIDVYMFLKLISFIADNYYNDYIIKNDIKIYKNDLSSIHYYINFDPYINGEPLCYLEYHFKDSSKDYSSVKVNNDSKIICEF